MTGFSFSSAAGNKKRSIKWLISCQTTCCVEAPVRCPSLDSVFMWHHHWLDLIYYFIQHFIIEFSIVLFLLKWWHCTTDGPTVRRGNAAYIKICLTLDFPSGGLTHSVPPSRGESGHGDQQLKVLRPRRSVPAAKLTYVEPKKTLSCLNWCLYFFLLQLLLDTMRINWVLWSWSRTFCPACDNLVWGDICRQRQYGSLSKAWLWQYDLITVSCCQ